MKEWFLFAHGPRSFSQQWDGTVGFGYMMRQTITVKKAHVGTKLLTL